MLTTLGQQTKELYYYQKEKFAFPLPPTYLPRLANVFCEHPLTINQLENLKKNLISMIFFSNNDLFPYL